MVIISLGFFAAAFSKKVVGVKEGTFNRLCLICITVLAASGGCVAAGGNILLRVIYVLLAQAAMVLTVISFEKAGWSTVQKLIPFFYPIIFIAALIVPFLIPDPKIDVWIVIQDAANALLNFQNPYALPHPGLQDHTFYFPHGYNYPPLLLPIYSFFYAILGDVRFTTVVALIGTWVIIRRVLPKTVTAQLLLLLYFINPLHLRVIEKSWTEGVIQLLLAVTFVTIMQSPSSLRAYLWAALTASSKQYLPLVGLFLFRTLTSVPKWIGACLVALVPIILFLLPYPAAFYNEVIGFFIHYPPRDDSLSLYSVLLRYWHFQPSVVLTLLPTFVVLILYFFRRRCSLAQSLRWMALGFYLLLLFGCSFANYYYILEAMLWWTVFVDYIDRRAASDA